MQEGLANYLKQKEVQLKFSNLEELCRAFLNVIDEDKKSLQVILNALYEQQVFFACIHFQAIRILCDKLSNIYNLQLNAEELIHKATSSIDQDWDKIKMQIKNENDAKKLIDSIFNDKPGESKGSNP